MPTDTEQSLLRDFVTDRDEVAFRHLVEHHVDMVFGCALRRTGDAELAEEVSQNVFTILARKAHRLRAGAGLAGWLHKTALYESTKALRGESRRRRKMKALAEHNQTQDQGNSSGDEVLPLVDEAVAELPDGDRQLILLHYFEGRTFREISQSVGKSEAASQKQASRALAKLEKLLKRRGVVASATALTSIFAVEAARGAPAGIATTLSSGALAGASSLTTSALITNAVQTMTYAKTKVAILVASAAAVPIGVQMKSIGDLKEDLDVYERREIEFVEQGERLAKLEAEIGALPPEILNVAGRGSVLTALLKRPGDVSARENKAKASGSTDAGDEAGGIGELAANMAGEIAFDLAASGEAFGSFADMMDDPAMRNMITRQMKVHLEMTYGDLLDYFDLGEDKRAALSEALLERQLALADIGMPSVDGEDGEFVATDVAEITAVQAEHDGRLGELLGAERFEEFQRFERSAAERDELATFREALIADGQELPFEIEQKLMAIMYEENNSADHTPPADSGGDPGLAATVLEDCRATQARVRQRAASILTPEQLGVFTKNQESHFKLLRAGIEMAAEMLEKGE